MPNDVSSLPNFVSFVYHQYFSGGAPTPPYLAGAGNVLVTATPIPAALPLFVSALGGLGYLGWRRRKAAA